MTCNITKETQNLNKELEKYERLLSSIEREKADVNNKVNKLESEKNGLMLCNMVLGVNSCLRECE